jgi:hypothetical protein
VNLKQLIEMAKNSNTQYATWDEGASSESKQESRAYLAQCPFSGG